jgi:hypothetical protein
MHIQNLGPAGDPDKSAGAICTLPPACAPEHTPCVSLQTTQTVTAIHRIYSLRLIWAIRCRIAQINRKLYSPSLLPKPQWWSWQQCFLTCINCSRFSHCTFRERYSPIFVLRLSRDCDTNDSTICLPCSVPDRTNPCQLHKFFHYYTCNMGTDLQPRARASCLLPSYGGSWCQTRPCTV